MKLKTLSPEQIMTVIVAMILFGIGIFAVFSVSIGLGVTVPGSTDNAFYGYYAGTNGSTAATAHVWSNNATGGTAGRAWISCPSYRNNTNIVIVEFYWKNTSAWVTLQAAGAANGTFMSGNSTYRVSGNTRSTTHDCNWAQAWRINYWARDMLKAGPNLAIKNVTLISNNVFNIIGIVLIVGAIMLIVGIVYSYIRPGGGSIIPPMY